MCFILLEGPLISSKNTSHSMKEMSLNQGKVELKRVSGILKVVVLKFLGEGSLAAEGRSFQETAVFVYGRFAIFKPTDPRKLMMSRQLFEELLCEVCARFKNLIMNRTQAFDAFKHSNSSR